MEKSKKSKNWVGVLRAIFWVVILLAWSVGSGLWRAGLGSKAAANGTADALIKWGQGVALAALLLFMANLGWGMWRWVRRGEAGGWTLGKTLGRMLWGGIWRGVVFGVILLVGAVLVAPMIEKVISNKVVAKEEAEWLTGQVGIREDFSKGNISPDEYLQYTLAAALAKDELPEQYRTDKTEIIPDIMGIIEEYGAEMKPETIQEALEVITMANVKIGPDASGNVAKGNDGLARVLDMILGAEPAMAYTKDVTTLNKAKLSSKGNFVVFYTDTGDDVITDAQAENLAEMMERIVRGYKERMGLEYEFEFFLTDGWNMSDLTSVLTENGLPVDLLETAMPAYVVNPYKGESNTLAFYTRRILKEFLQQTLVTIASWFPGGSDIIDQSKLMTSVPGVPFITILPANLSDESLELVTAHELGHHYEDLYCYSHGGDSGCTSGDFTMETAANWMAVNVVEEQPENNLIQRHLEHYIRRGTCYRIDNVLPEPPEEDACHSSGSIAGYPAVAFLKNYEDIVSDGQAKIMESLMHTDTLDYLRERATESEFAKLMTVLAQKNLTSEYEEVALHALNEPRGPNLDCEGKLTCSATFSLRPTAIKYVYLSTEEYDKVKVAVDAAGNDVISILGRKVNGGWTAIDEAGQKLEYTATKESEYDMVAFAVANTSVTEGGEFTVSAVVEELEEKVDPGVEKKFTETSGLDNGCMEVDFQKMMDDLLQIGKSTFELLETMGVETGETGAFEENINEAKQSMMGRKMTMCETWMREGVSAGEIEGILRRSMRVSWNLMTTELDGSEVRVIVGLDEARRQGKIYLLGVLERRVYVLEIRVEEV